MQPDGTELNLSYIVPFDWNGTDAVEVTIPAIADGNYQVVATATDSDGVDTPLSNQAGFLLDTSGDVIIDAPVLAIAEAQPDGLVNELENADGVQVQVTVLQLRLRTMLLLPWWIQQVIVSMYQARSH